MERISKKEYRSFTFIIAHISHIHIVGHIICTLIFWMKEIKFTVFGYINLESQ